MVKWLRRLFGGDLEARYLEQQEKSTEPWASFEVAGFEEGGRVKIKFNWNKPFIAHIKGLGFEAETEEDTVQLFFYASSMRPERFGSDPGDDAVQSSAHPQLSHITNELRT